MKKEFNLGVLLVFALLTACGGGNKNNTNEGDTTVSSVQSLDSAAVQNLILRDSITVLKYKNQVDTIAFPVINPQFPALAKSVTPEEVLGERLFEIKENYENCGCGYIFLSYEKSFSNSKIISLVFQTAFLGPYPSETTIYQTLSIQSGKKYKLSNQLNETGQQYVLKTYKETLLTRLEADKAKYNEDDYQEAYHKIKENVSSLTFRAIDDNYIVKDGFILAKTEAVLPHAILAWEINRKVEFSLDELKQFRKNDASI